MCLVDLVKHVWRTGEIPQELECTILVLVMKGAINTQVIGLLETLWKVLEALIYTRLRASLKMHDILRGFRAGRETGTAIMELKIAQDLSSIYQDPLFLVFLYLHKAYDTIDWDCLIITLDRYVVGLRMCGFLKTFWE